VSLMRKQRRAAGYEGDLVDCLASGRRYVVSNPQAAEQLAATEAEIEKTLQEFGQWLHQRDLQICKPSFGERRPLNHKNVIEEFLAERARP
jgi:hypothetical protein